jgi:ligand-binding sensor domain-containing protein/serine phosphatase RsbU (regulator of sigma subunit)
MKKIFFTTSYFILLFSILAQNEIPTNSTENNIVSNWKVANITNFDEKKTNTVVENTSNYLNQNEKNVKNINLSDFNEVSVSLYQLFNDISFKSTFIASSIIEANKEQNYGLSFRSSDINASIYVNGSKVKSFNSGMAQDIEIFLNKGSNKVLIIGKGFGQYLSTFRMKIYNETYGQINLKVIDEKNNPIRMNDKTLIKSEETFREFSTDKNGEKLLWVKPGEYRFWSSYENKYAWTETINIIEGEKREIRMIISNKSKINGEILTLDNKTPNPGLLVEILDSKTGKSFWKTKTSSNGKFSFLVPNGSWNVRTFQDDKFLYFKKNGKTYDIEINDNSKDDINLTLNAKNSIKGSWGKISMFDGMLSNSTHKSIVSSEDLLYLGTYNGLSVFDGLKVESYNYDQGLPNGYIDELIEDYDGNIWIGYGEKGLVKWRNGNVIKHYTTEDGLPSNRINALDQDSDGNIIIGTGKGLSIFNGKSFENFDFRDGLGNGFITEIKVIGKNIWIGSGSQPNAGGQVTIGGGLTVFNGKIFKSYDLSTLSGFNPWIACINKIENDNKGNIWIGTMGGLLKYNESRFEIISQSNGLPSNTVRDILIDDNGIWVGTDGGLVNIEEERIKNIVSLENNFGEVTSISKSKDGIYFIGTGDGVVMYDPNSFRTISSTEGMASTSNWTRGTLDIAIDKDGYIWAATGTSGLFKLKNESVIEQFTYSNSGLPHNYICQIEFSKDGSIWIVQHSHVSRYFKGEIKVMNDELQIPTNIAIRDLAFDSEGTIWFATNRGLGRFKNDNFKLFNEADGLVRPDGNCDVNIGKNEEIIYSTYGSGFSIFDGEKFINYDETRGLADNRIWDMAIDSKNNYWLALDGAGVQKFDGEKFKNFQIKDGVTAGETFTAYVDDFDMVWIGTFGGGVCYFDGEMWNSVDTRDGLLDDLVQSICGIDGEKYWFGSAKGITAYEPKQQAPQVTIERIETPNQSYRSIEELEENKENILQETRIKFILNSNSFNTKSDKQKYIVNIKRKSSKESYLIKTNEFEFFPEKIGKYIIEFQSIDRDMNYSKLKQIEIKVVGPWYKNLATAIPFWGFLVLLISLSGYSSNKYLSQRKYTAKLKEEAQTKDREARERLEEKNKEIVDSINYAKRIQDAMMTSEGYRKSVVPKSFTFFKPKDVVSGDFYWVFKDKEENVFFTVADCTGHGVPGAFMSMIGTSLLNEIIVEKGISDTNKILDEMRTQIIKSLNQDTTDDQKDGMDISICKLNMKKKTLEFSGAHNPLVIVSGNELKTVKGDSQAVGLETVDIKPFTKHSIKLKKDDMIYIYSDGYQDQFGGENGKKYMTANFKKLLLKISKEDEKKQNKLLEIELANWMQKEEQIDDICIMGVRV